jgi:hypothetical protein
VNAVTVWDLDALRVTTLAAMGTQIGPVQRAALDSLDWTVFERTLITTAEDIAVRRALDVALTPTGLGVVLDALLGVIDGIYDYVSYRDQALLAKSELLAASGTARRILTHDPSLVPVFLDVVGILGDAATVVKFPRIAQQLRRLHTTVLLATAGPEFTTILTQVVVALVAGQDSDKRSAETRRP